jgi:hypothetical protein
MEQQNIGVEELSAELHWRLEECRFSEDAYRLLELQKEIKELKNRINWFGTEAITPVRNYGYSIHTNRI